MMTVDDALSLKRMLAMSWVYLGLLVAGSWAFGSWSFAWAVLVGGILSVASFWISYRDVAVFIEALGDGTGQTVVGTKAKTSKKGLILKFWLRIFLIGIVLLLFIKYGGINIFGLILGLTTIVFTVTMSGLSVIWRYYFSGR